LSFISFHGNTETRNLSGKYKIFRDSTDNISNILRSAASLVQYRWGFHYCYSRCAVVWAHYLRIQWINTVFSARNFEPLH